MALERIRGKKSKRAKGQQSFLEMVARAGVRHFSQPKRDLFKGLKPGTLTGDILVKANKLVDEIGAELAAEGIKLSNKVIEFSDAITDLAAEVSPLDKRVERVLDGILDFPTEAYFRAWIFTLQFYLDSIEQAKEKVKTRIKVTPPKLTPEQIERGTRIDPPELSGVRRGPSADI